MITKNLHIKSFVGFLFLLLVTASCSNDEEVFVMPSSEGVKLEVTTEDNDNASTRTAGDNSLNENLFVTLDYYFFSANDEQATLKVKLSEENLTDNTRHVYSGRRLTDTELEAAFGKSITELVGGERSYVYVVANLPVNKLDAATQAAIANKSITLGQLRRKEFQTTDISKNGVQASFVMYGGANVTLSVTGTGTDRKMSLSGQVRVKRDAAKVVLTVTEVKKLLRFDANGNQIDDDDEVTVPVTFWKSNPDDMYVMFYNGVNKSTIHSMINSGYHYTPGRPDGSIDNECYFTLDNTDPNSSNPWRKLVQGTGNVNRTHQYPFYTYLSDWSASGVKERASYMILVVPWQQVDASGNPVQNEYNGSTEFEYTYYQIETTPVDEYAYYENTFYQILLTVGVLGSFELPEPVVVNAQYMVVPWGTVDVPGTLREGKYLILETREYTMNNINSASIPYITSHEITSATVTNVEYLSLQTFQPTPAQHRQDGTWRTYPGSRLELDETFTVSTANNLLTLEHEISPNQYTRYRVTVHVVNAAGLEDTVVFTIYPAIYANNETGGNAFINGRFAYVKNPPTSGGQGWYQVSGNYYRSSPRYNNNNNNNFIDAGYGSLRWDFGSGGVENASLTRITVTSFNEDDSQYTIRKNNVNTPYTYKLTDPRVEDASLNSVLTNYFITAESNRTNQTTADWDNLATLKRGADASDLIAPDFIICSGWGRTQGMNAQNFDTFERRCATYQEAGYPAGRWRLPTEAELAYIYKLQEIGVIPILFQQSGSAYWASSGWAVQNYTNGVANFINNPSVVGPNTAGVRCVYDVWYWGEPDLENYPANEYHAMPTK